MTPRTPPRTSTRLSRVEQRARTRERLLAAAAEAFAEHGVDGAAVDDIAARAGYSRGAFYSNFRDKTELLIALCEEQLASFRQDQLPDLLARGDEQQQLAAAARWLAAEHPPLEVLLVVELARQRSRTATPDAALTGAIDRVLAALGDVLAEAGADGHTRGADDPAAAQERADRSAAALAAVLGADLLRHLGRPPTPRVLELLLAGLGDQDRP
ncbi:MAG: TetR/AcrR family transcriptional regulator [Nitriliruptoraceae bacterium]